MVNFKFFLKYIYKWQINIQLAKLEEKKNAFGTISH